MSGLTHGSVLISLIFALSAALIVAAIPPAARTSAVEPGVCSLPLAS